MDPRESHMGLPVTCDNVRHLSCGVCVCVCVCEREREREREIFNSLVCLGLTPHPGAVAHCPVTQARVCARVNACEGGISPPTNPPNPP